MLFFTFSIEIPVRSLMHKITFYVQACFLVVGVILGCVIFLSGMYVCMCKGWA
jgi:hypothetical protein